MRFLSSNKADKIYLVISDLHLGAGSIINGRRNPLEDFHADTEFVAFLEYYSSGEFSSQTIELVINGDLLDLLAVPFVQFFDDEFWSEKAAREKLRMILEAHPQVMTALDEFLSVKNKTMTFIIGNHDAEMVFDSLKKDFLNYFSQENQNKILLSNDVDVYNPEKGLYFLHGHQYEHANNFDLKTSIIESSKGDQYFKPTWGSYYVTHIMNRYKTERDFINVVRPVKNMIIHGLLYDTFFILRFCIANAYYFLMVRIMSYLREGAGWRGMIRETLAELSLFQDYEQLTRRFFVEYPDAKVLVTGHTHKPSLREYLDGTTFVNTGSWIKMVNINLDQTAKAAALTYAVIEVENKTKESLTTHLYYWSPRPTKPYQEFTAY